MRAARSCMLRMHADPALHAIGARMDAVLCTRSARTCMPSMRAACRRGSQFFTCPMESVFVSRREQLPALQRALGGATCITIDVEWRPNSFNPARDPLLLPNTRAADAGSGVAAPGGAALAGSPPGTPTDAPSTPRSQEDAASAEGGSDGSPAVLGPVYGAPAATLQIAVDTRPLGAAQATGNGAGGGLDGAHVPEAAPLQPAEATGNGAAADGTHVAEAAPPQPLPTVAVFVIDLLALGVRTPMHEPHVLCGDHMALRSGVSYVVLRHACCLKKVPPSAPPLHTVSAYGCTRWHRYVPMPL
jgi:hypothetical protein